MANERERDPHALECEQWEAMLADRMDREAAASGDLKTDQAPTESVLPADEEAAFAEHAKHCPGCGELLRQARQGREWLRVLGEQAPAPPTQLLSKILAQTRGAGLEADFPIGTAAATGLSGAPGRWGIPLLGVAAGGASPLPGQRAHHARMIMTGAMAFFSIALTLSLAGVKLTQVHAAELRPQAMQADVTRSFYGTKKQVVSFYENLRLVYEVESKMKELRQDAAPSAEQPAVRPATPPAKQPAASPAKPKSSGAAALEDRPAEHRGKGAAEPVVRGRPESAKVTGTLFVARPAIGIRCSFKVRQGASSQERKRL